MKYLCNAAKDSVGVPIIYFFEFLGDDKDNWCYVLYSTFVFIPWGKWCEWTIISMNLYKNTWFSAICEELFHQRIGGEVRSTTPGRSRCWPFARRHQKGSSRRLKSPLTGSDLAQLSVFKSNQWSLYFVAICQWQVY